MTAANSTPRPLYVTVAVCHASGGCDARPSYGLTLDGVPETEFCSKHTEEAMRKLTSAGVRYVVRALLADAPANNNGEGGA